MPLDIQSWVRGDSSSADKGKTPGDDFDPKAFLNDSSEPAGSTLGDIGRGAAQGAGELAETVGTYITPGGPLVARAIGRALGSTEPGRQIQQFITEDSKSFPQAATRFGVANAPFVAMPAGATTGLPRVGALVLRELAARGVPAGIAALLAHGLRGSALMDLAAALAGGARRSWLGPEAEEVLRSIGFHTGGISTALGERLGLGELARRARGGTNGETEGSQGAEPRQDRQPPAPTGGQTAGSARRSGQRSDNAATDQRPESRWVDPNYFPQTERGNP